MRGTAYCAEERTRAFGAEGLDGGIRESVAGGLEGTEPRGQGGECEC